MARRMARAASCDQTGARPAAVVSARQRGGGSFDREHDIGGDRRLDACRQPMPARSSANGSADRVRSGTQARHQRATARVRQRRLEASMRRKFWVEREPPRSAAIRPGRRGAPGDTSGRVPRRARTIEPPRQRDLPIAPPGISTTGCELERLRGARVARLVWDVVGVRIAAVCTLS